MGRFCKIKCCKTIQSDDLSLFKVPTEDKTKQEWCTYVEKEGFKGKFNRKSLFHICELHFCSESINAHGGAILRSTLVANAIPTVVGYYEVKIIVTK